MTTALHSLLGLDKSNPLFEILFDPEVPDDLLVHFGMHFLEKVKRNTFEESLLAARLYNANFSRKVLTEVFGFHRNTLRRWGKALRSGNIEEIKNIGIGSGSSTRIFQEHKRFICSEYEESYRKYGCHTNTYISKKFRKVFNFQISNESIRLVIKEQNDKEGGINNSDDMGPCLYPLVLYSAELKMVQDIQRYFSPPLVSLKSENSSNDEFNCESVEKLASNNFKISKGIHPSGGLPCNFPMVKKVSSPQCLCHHAGLLLCRIFIDAVSENLGELFNITRQWIAMILSGCVNIEQGRGLSYQSLELLIGQQIISAYRQREHLHNVSIVENVHLLFRQNLYLVKAEREQDFYYDPHGIGYTGQLKTLKNWLGSKHRVEKGYNLDLIHTMNGEPVFSDIDDNYYDMRQRFLTNIGRFRGILGTDMSRTLIITVDRAIYDVEFMKESRSKNIHIITWEKNYKKGQWDNNSKYPVKTFYIRKYKNTAEDSQCYIVEYFKQSWHKEKSFAQYTIMLSKPKKERIELSVICTDYEKDAEIVIRSILCRWIQEIDIGYLIFLGINQITSYSSFSYTKIAETLKDREFDNKKYKLAAAERLELKKELGLLLLKREESVERYGQMQSEIQQQINKIILNPEKGIEGKVKKLKTKQKRLIGNREKFLTQNQEKQKSLHHKIEELEKIIEIEQPKISRLDFLLENEYKKLNFMPKSFMDSIKIIARNILYELLKIFRPIYNNRRNDHVILRELIKSGGFIEEKKNQIIVALNPARKYQKKEKDKILFFLFQISNKVNQLYKPDKTIIFTLYNF